MHWLFQLVVWLALPSAAMAQGWQPRPMAYFRTDGERATVLRQNPETGRGEVALFLTRAGERLHSYRSEEISITCFSYDPKNRHFLLFGDMEGNLGYWPAGSPAPTDLFPAHYGPVRTVGISPTGGMLVTGGQDGRALVLATRPAQVIHELRGHGGPVTSVSWLHPNRVVTACEDGALRIFNPVNSELVHEFRPQNSPILHVSCDFGPGPLSRREGRFGVSTTADGHAQLWDFLALQNLATMTSSNGRILGGMIWRKTRYDERVNQVLHEPLMVLTWTDEGAVEARSIPSGSLTATLYRHPVPIADLRLATDGNLILVVDEQGDSVVIQSRRGTVTNRIPFIQR